MSVDFVDASSGMFVATFGFIATYFWQRARRANENQFY